MIAKVTRGSDMPHLIRYLFSDGAQEAKGNEHEDQRVIAADESVDVAFGVMLSSGEQTRLGRVLDAPSAVYGTEIGAGHVWHLSLATKGGSDRDLSDEEWSEVVHGVVAQLGFDSGVDQAPCRWVAVRHGKSANENDHIHLAVNLVREDGRVASTSNDFRKLSRLCRDMEARYGLTVVEGRVKGTAIPAPKRAELEKAERLGRGDPERIELARIVRAAAQASGTEDEFVRRLRDADLAAKPRYDRSGTHRVVGYSVAQEPRDGGQVVFFAGGTLARDLSLPALRRQWNEAQGGRLEAAAEWGQYERTGATSDELRPGRYRLYEWREAAAEWGPGRPASIDGGPERAIYDPWQWHEAGQRIGGVVRSLADVALDDTVAWRRAAGDAAGVLAGLSGRLEAVPGPIARASDVLAKSAQGRDTGGATAPAGVPSGTMRTVAAVMAQAQITDEVALAWQLMLTELLRLAQAIQQAHLARAETGQAGRLADEARSALDEARVQLGSSQRVAELVPALVEAVREEEERDEEGSARRKRSSAVRPEEYAAMAARKRSPQWEPARGSGR